MEMFLKKGDEGSVSLEKEKLTEVQNWAGINRENEGVINTHLWSTTLVYEARELSTGITSQLPIQQPKFKWFKAQQSHGSALPN